MPGRRFTWCSFATSEDEAVVVVLRGYVTSTEAFDLCEPLVPGIKAEGVQLLAVHGQEGVTFDSREAELLDAVVGHRLTMAEAEKIFEAKTLGELRRTT